MAPSKPSEHGDIVAKQTQVCKWFSLQEALRSFVTHDSGTQSSEHIKPLHYYVACRLVVEGGFEPDNLTPHPPFRIENKSGRKFLHIDNSRADGKEATVLGGLKTKNIDVVAAKPGIGPVIAASMKGTGKAFRNLTNRMEEAVGDCTNLHVSYPALVYGFLHILKAHRGNSDVPKSDWCLDASGEAVSAVARYHDVLARLTDRQDLRDDPTKYEAVSLILASTDPGFEGTPISTYPTIESTLHFATFFERLYRAYDLRYVFTAPDLKGNKRLIWDEDSPAFEGHHPMDYQPRVGLPEPESD